MSILHIIPGHHGVPTSQSGGVKLKYGGDVHAIRNRYQCVHDLLLRSTEATPQSFIICIQLWEGIRKGKSCRVNSASQAIGNRFII